MILTLWWRTRPTIDHHVKINGGWVRAAVGVLVLLLVAGCSTDAARPGAPDGFEHRDAAVPGTRLHYVIGGAGPPVVLLHGFPETWFTWRGVLPALASEHTVIAVDLRGVGGSRLAATGYDKSTMAADVHALVRSLGFERAAVVGHDLGAWVAYAYARQFRDEVSHLVLASAALPGFGLERLLDPASPRHLPHLLAFQRPDAAARIEGREREFLERFVTSDAARRNGALDEFTAAYRRPGRLAAALRQYAAIPIDIRDNQAGAGPALTMPVLAVDGGSAELPLASARRVAVDVTAVAVPGAGHYVQEDRPDALAGALLRFLAVDKS